MGTPPILIFFHFHATAILKHDFMILNDNALNIFYIPYKVNRMNFILTLSL